MEAITLSKSNLPSKKYKVKVGNKTIHFGSADHEDFTTHKDPERKQRYINRHKARENWTKSGVQTAGYWAKNLLWNKPTLKESIKDVENKLGVKIKN